MLGDLHPKLQERPYIKDLQDGLNAMLPLLDVPEGKAFTQDEVNSLREKAHILAQVVKAQLPE